MRPKKSILLLCPNEIEASLRNYQMKTWGFKVTVALRMEDAVREASERSFDLALLIPPQMEIRLQEFYFAAFAIEFYQNAAASETRIYDRLGSTWRWIRYGPAAGRPGIFLGDGQGCCTDQRDASQRTSH